MRVGKRQLEQALHVRVQSDAERMLENMALLVSGGIIGAAAMYVFDHRSGRRRRALARDKAIHLVKQAQWFGTRKAEDLRNRAIGSVQEIRSKVRDARHMPIEDDVLQERARAQLGHVVSHPGALEVRANEGRVTVTGPVLRGERAKIETRLNKTRGVQGMDIKVTEHDSREGIPGLQGESRAERRDRVAL